VGYENLGTTGKGKGASSAGHAINDSGQVACESNGNSVMACRYSDDEGLIKLGTLGGTNSYCNGGGINNQGETVGYSDLGNENKMHLFLYTDALGMVDLEASITNLPADLNGYLRTPGLRINNAGDVCGKAGDGTGDQPSLLGRTYEAYVLNRLDDQD
jgi:probable HAF family extracellular repeat protein